MRSNSPIFSSSLCLRERVNETNVEIRSCLRSCRFSDHQTCPGLPWITGSPDHPISVACSGWKSSATDPLHPKSCEINGPSGVAE
jgi:hypothetical protein